MEYLEFCLAAAGFILLIMGKWIYDDHRAKKDFLKKLKNNYGIIEEKDYGADRFQAVTKYFTHHREEEQIDDIKSFIDNKEILNFISKIEQELILKIDKSINKILNADYSLDRKSFALKYKPTTEGFIFGVMMKKYSGLCEDVVTELKKSMLKTFTTESKVKNFLGL